MIVGINGVSGRGGRWMFSQRGRGWRSTVSAGHEPGLLCLPNTSPQGSEAEACPAPIPPLPPSPRQANDVMAIQVSTTLWSKPSIFTPSNCGPPVSIKTGRLRLGLICVPPLDCGAWAHDECSGFYRSLSL